ncbi:hypothetical protein MBLNU457_g2575t1 [Dothideomycetes sp. NU457]
MCHFITTRYTCLHIFKPQQHNPFVACERYRRAYAAFMADPRNKPQAVVCPYQGNTEYVTLDYRCVQCETDHRSGGRMNSRRWAELFERIKAEYALSGRNLSVYR